MFSTNYVSDWGFRWTINLTGKFPVMGHKSQKTKIVDVFYNDLPHVCIK